MRDKQNPGLEIHVTLEAETLSQMTDAEFERIWSAYGEIIRLAANARARRNPTS